MFAHQRHIIAQELKDDVALSRDLSASLKDIAGELQFSAICGDVAVQALVFAATMGLASYVKEASIVKGAGQWIAGFATGARGTAAVRNTVTFVADVGGASSGATGAEALTGLISRAAAGTIILLVRTGVSMSQGDQQKFGDIAGALLLTVLLAWIGSPGAAARVKLIGPLKNVVVKLPSAFFQPVARAASQGGGTGLMLTAQGNVQITGLLKDVVNVLVRYGALKDVVASRGAILQRIQDCAEAGADNLVKQALRNTQNLRQQVEAKVEQQMANNHKKWSDMVPLAASLSYRRVPRQDLAQTLRENSIDLAIYSTLVDYWTRVHQCLQTLEPATNLAKRVISQLHP